MGREIWLWYKIHLATGIPSGDMLFSRGIIKYHPTRDGLLGGEIFDFYDGEVTFVKNGHVHKSWIEREASEEEVKQIKLQYIFNLIHAG